MCLNMRFSTLSIIFKDEEFFLLGSKYFITDNIFFLLGVESGTTFIANKVANVYLETHTLNYYIECSFKDLGTKIV